ncbi:hypothetical protein FRB96_000281 [Tulasnella sp. 330]|nr:hypothetical protein FRB96_000281 [Tulasnella sp. 330]
MTNKHLYPIALKDFEEYLLFTEHTVENLYFVVWLRDYTRAYDAYMSMPAEPPESLRVVADKLALLFARALATFFDIPSNLALNLPHTLVMPIREIAEQTSIPPPEALHQAHEYVREMLKESLKRFLRSSYRNADTNRVWFAYVNGWVMAIAMVGITILGIFLGWPRMTRLASYPILALAIATIFASTQGVCLGIFALTDSRQLRPFELAAPRSPATANRRVSTSPNKQSQPPHAPRSEADDPPNFVIKNSFSRAPELEEGDGGTVGHQPDSGKTLKLDKQPFIADDNPITSSIPVSSSTWPMTSIATPEPTHTIDTSSPFVFDFDTLPAFYPLPSSHTTNTVPSTRRSKSLDIKTTDSQTNNLLLDSSPVFAELMRVSDPIVMRSRWQIFIRSLLYGTSIATLIMVVLMAVPYPHGTRH